MRRSGQGRRGVPVLPGRDQPQHAAALLSPDMNDGEWAVCEPVLPDPAWLAGKGSRPAGYCMRDVVAFAI